MKDKKIHRILIICIAMVWAVNGLFCKVLNFVPRHEQIIARILGDTYSRPIAVLIGLSEIGMAIWVLSGIGRRLNVIAQIITISTMNVLEFILAPDLLYWGKANLMFACMFIMIIYFNEFYFNKRYEFPA